MPSIKVPMDAERRELNQALEAAEEQQAGRALMAKQIAAPIRNDFVTVRVYAHQVRSGRQPGEAAATNAVAGSTPVGAAGAATTFSCGAPWLDAPGGRWMIVSLGLSAPTAQMTAPATVMMTRTTPISWGDLLTQSEVAVAGEWHCHDLGRLTNSTWRPCAAPVVEEAGTCTEPQPH